MNASPDTPQDIRDRLQERGLTEEDISEAIEWARRQPERPAPPEPADTPPPPQSSDLAQ